MFKNEFIKFDEDTNLCVYLWEPISDVKGVIQIAHGMAEHLARYDEFGEFFKNQGYLVIGADHYAHGKSVKDVKDLGVCEKYDFLTAVLNSIKLVRETYKDRFIGKTVLFSHSMGSMATQRYMELYPNDFQYIVLSGSDYPDFMYAISKMITKGKGKVGKTIYSDFVESVGIGAFNKKFKDENDPIAWLSVDIDNRRRYSEDELCGKRFPVNYFYSLSKTLRDSKKAKNLKLINKELHLFVLCGEFDPVGKFTKGPKKLYKQYTKLHLDTTLKIYPNARHECLKESNIKDEVLQDVLNFINK